MKQVIASKIFRKFLILGAMLTGLVFIGYGEGAKAKTAANNCCSNCNYVWEYCLTHYGHPNDPYKTYGQCIEGLDPDCSDLECDPGC